MKPLQIGLLVAAGALGGALVMKWQSTRHSNETIEMTATAVPTAVPAAVPASSDPAAAAEQPAPEPPAAVGQPSPFPEKNQRHAPKKPPSKPRSEPAVIAQVQAPPAAEPAAPAAPARAPEPPAPAPPVRSAPEPVKQPEPAPPAPEPEPNRVTLSAGTMIPIRLVDGLSTERSVAGDSFTATLDAPLVVSGFAIAERGARVEGKVVDSQKAGKASGVSSLGIVLTQITTSDGQHVHVETQTFTKKGDTSHGQDAAKVGAGAGIGAVIGAIAGGGRGAGIGAAVGGAAGAGDVLLTRGKPATLATETRINFRLSQAVTITERP
jgi:outer membrane biosynthesis protein TonB